MKSLRTFFLALFVAFTCAFLASCGSRPSSKLHKAAVPDADAFLYFDFSKLAELDDAFPDDLREKLEEEIYSDMEGDEIEQLEKDFLEAIKTLDLKVMVSANNAEGQTAFACQTGKDIPLYVLYKGAAAMAKSLENTGSSDMRNFAEFFKHSIMPIKDENILVFGDEEVTEALAENLNDGGEPLSKNLLNGIPKNSFLYGGCALNEDSPASEPIESLGLGDCMEDAEVVNFGIERAGKGKLRLVVNVIYEDKDAAKDKLSDVEEFLDKAEEQLEEAEEHAGDMKELLEELAEIVKKATVKRDGKAIRMEFNFSSEFLVEYLNESLLAGLSKARDKAQAISCINNLKQILVGIMIHADDNDDYFPPSLDTLVDEGWFSQKILQCPACGEEYTYFGSSAQRMSQIKDPASTIVVLCEHEHSGFPQAGFADGHVESVPKEAVEKALKNRRGGLPVLERDYWK